MSEDWSRFFQNISRDLSSNGVENFMDSPTVKRTMLVCGNGNIQSQKEFCNSVFHDATVNKVLKDEVLGVDHPNKVQTLYHLAKFVDNGGVIPEKGTIVEVGAGVGCMVDLIRGLGFKGTYHIIDKEPVTDIQKYYLKKNKSLKNVKFGAPESVKVDMMIGMWSISEIPEEGRKVYLSYNADYFLFAYGSKFGGNPNIPYFEEMQKSHKRNSWVSVPFVYNADQTYLIGVPSKYPELQRINVSGKVLEQVEKQELGDVAPHNKLEEQEVVEEIPEDNKNLQIEIEGEENE